MLHAGKGANPFRDGMSPDAGQRRGRGCGQSIFDIVISDVRMPGLTGLDVLAILRCANWATPVILITAFGDEATHAEGRELGAVAVFDKPFNVEQLRAAVLETMPPF